MPMLFPRIVFHSIRATLAAKHDVRHGACRKFLHPLCPVGAGSGNRHTQRVENAYQMTLLMAFTQRAARLYWKRATTQGATLAIALGLAV